LTRGPDRTVADRPHDLLQPLRGRAAGQAELPGGLPGGRQPGPDPELEPASGEHGQRMRVATAPNRNARSGNDGNDGNDGNESAPDRPPRHRSGGRSRGLVWYYGRVPLWLDVVLGVAAGLVLAWLLLLALLLRAAPDRGLLAESLRLLPDLLRLIGRLARDRELPRGVRFRLWLLAAYLALPIDLIPDVVPVIGYADDAVAVALVLRSVVRTAGPSALERHWPGTPDGLATVRRLAGLAPG
jgi:uncharacterized membrane protein YkvA (DUF1232 family)